MNLTQIDQKVNTLNDRKWEYQVQISDLQSALNELDTKRNAALMDIANGRDGAERLVEKFRKEISEKTLQMDDAQKVIEIIDAELQKLAAEKLIIEHTHAVQEINERVKAIAITENELLADFAALYDRLASYVDERDTLSRNPARDYPQSNAVFAGIPRSEIAIELHAFCKRILHDFPAALRRKIAEYQE